MKTIVLADLNNDLSDRGITLIDDLDESKVESYCEYSGLPSVKSYENSKEDNNNIVVENNINNKSDIE